MSAPRVVLCAALALISAGCPHDWKHDLIDPAPFTVDSAAWSHMQCTKLALEQAGSAWQEAQTLHVHCARADRPSEQVFCNTPPGDREARPIDPWKLRPLMSFVHLSDAQIKDPSVHLTGFFGPDSAYDNLSTSSRRDELLEKHAPGVLLATALGIDKLVRDGATPSSKPCKAPCYRPPLPPSFLIHTGDAADAGMVTELYQLIGALDQVPIPWFDVVGNHDTLSFGTFTSLDPPSPPPPPPVMTVGGGAAFMRYHDPRTKPFASSFPFPLAHPPHGPTVSPTTYGGPPGSSFHGFDFACRERKPHELCPEARGYYAYEVDLPGRRSALESGFAAERKLRVVVLNTSEVPGCLPSSDGGMTDEQLQWFQRQLAFADQHGSYVLVFGHHNLNSFSPSSRGDEIRDELVKHRRVLGYVTGHTHVDDFHVWQRDSDIAPPLWEIIGGSTLVYPQLGRLIELMEDEPSGKLYLRVLTMRQGLGDRADVMRSARGELASCPTPNVDACLRARYRGQSLCQELADRAWLGRAGAHRDGDDDARAEWDAVTKTNGTMLVYDPRVLKMGVP